MRLDAATSDRLEWSKLLDQLQLGVRTAMGKQAAATIAPSLEPAEIDRMQARVEEMRRLHAEYGRLPLSELKDPAESLQTLQVAGKRLTGVEIFELVALVAVAKEAASAFRKLEPETFVELGAEWARFPDLDPILHSIQGNLSATGRVEDRASPELGRLRREIRHLSERLTKLLDSLLKAEGGGPVIRDNYYTQRNNRFVVPVRTDTPRRFAGIVHGTSASEKTLFVEPLETVEINNDLVRLADDEQAEVERILDSYTALLRAYRGDIAISAERLGEIDLLESIASWADERRAVRPDFVEGGGLRLEAARHPLLEATLAREHPSRAVIPLTLDLPREVHALVISGPNAGGKTVALKTIGLLTLMAHAGLPVPAIEARFPLITELMADIGDEQSIAESLSTFASHVRNLGLMLRTSGQRALALIDEVGTGTDPAEGAALGIAVIERLVQQGVRVVVTTHHAAIKSWAYRTSGALNAACDFDDRTMRPTYRLVAGVAGASVGLTMAEQLGMPLEVVRAAQAKLDPAGAEASRALDAVRQLAADLEQQRERLVADRRALEAQELERQSRWQRDEEQRRLEWGERIDKMSKAFRQEVDRWLGSLDDQKERRAMERERAARERSLREQFSEEHRAARVTDPVPEAWLPKAGETVHVVSLGREGVVRRVDAGRVEIQLGRALFSLKLADLRPLGAATSPLTTEATAVDSAKRRAPELPVGIKARIAEREVPRELNLIGQRVEPALEALERYVDDALLAGLVEIRIVHGFGTGALKKAVRQRLTTHADVESWRDASPDEGGGGATLATLRED